ncbi:MAG TPA: TetR/AcrR family transcriptional regulator [Devosiaceae bacterium]|nr:TetR/AcrR family transcriptional regulator [Devosiaceae bacterium]
MAEAVRRGSAERRQRIVEAARFLVLRHGLRATTMEAVAREARVAKPTLYGYFPDKEAVFLAIVEELVADLLAAFEAGLAGEGDVVARLAAALVAKYRTIETLLAGSPHAAELYDEHDRAAGPFFRLVEETVERGITAELQAAGVREPQVLTRVLAGAAYGIGRKFRDMAEIERGIVLLVERLVRPELPR